MKLKRLLILTLCLTMTLGGALTSCRQGGGGYRHLGAHHRHPHVSLRDRSERF